MRTAVLCIAAAVTAAGLLVYPCASFGDDAATTGYPIQLAQAAPPYGPPQPYGPPPPPQEGPPGEWVEVPGAWVNGQWVPAHRTWVPVNPGGGPVAPPPVASPQPAYPPPPPPAYTLPGPPEVLPIPGTYAYYVPGVNVDIFFYQGYWYRPYGAYWYRAPAYNGPWVYVPGPRVPRVFFTLPPGWRRVPPGYHPIPHHELQRNWRQWERERHWDEHHRR